MVAPSIIVQQRISKLAKSFWSGTDFISNNALVCLALNPERYV
ncbi:unnamed protein product [Larinioides sclopetarius]|uniref:Uncharacterized protein n=1 Tax=Larinioides sclopetarius TaxID=280406 RepID=A0AAV2C013_9ARAC